MCDATGASLKQCHGWAELFEDKTRQRDPSVYVQKEVRLASMCATDREGDDYQRSC